MKDLKSKVHETKPTDKSFVSIHCHVYAGYQFCNKSATVNRTITTNDMYKTVINTFWRYVHSFHAWGLTISLTSHASSMMWLETLRSLLQRCRNTVCTETHYTWRDTGEIFEAITLCTCKDNTTRKWDYMGKAYIVELMEEMGSTYRILNNKLKRLLQRPIKQTNPLQMSYCNHTLQVAILLSVTFHWVIIKCEHEDSNPLISYTA
jgi:hypothetical protein